MSSPHHTAFLPAMKSGEPIVYFILCSLTDQVITDNNPLNLSYRPGRIYMDRTI